MNQMAWPGWPVSTVLRVRVTDAVGNGVAGMPVTFTVTAGGGTIASAPAATDTAGVAASEVWTLGPDSGEQHVQASSGSASTSFTAFAIQPHFALKGRLAFVSAVDGNADIYTMNADGTGIERLTTDPEQELQPVWAPAGDQLAFTVGDAGSTRIHTMNADGSNVKGLTPEQSYSSDPSWSAGPDGLKLAYASQRDGSDDIVSLNTSTGVVSVLAGLPGYDGQPSWSPDGRRLAFVIDYEFYDFVLDVFTMNADGTGQVPITHSMNLGASPMRYYQHPAWSPDGNLIAFVWGEDFGSSVGVSFHVAVMAPDGSGVRNLAWAGDINRYHYFLDPGSLAWSPDGRGIAFSFADCEGGTADGVPGPVCPTRSVKYVPLTGGEAVTLIPNGHSPSWR
jgi:Tol biopolymer transport system component